MRARRLWVGAAVGALLAVQLVGCKGSGGSSAGEGFSPGQTAPAFTLTDVDGRKVSLADYKGKVVLVNFWATWCGPCRMELPDLVKLHDAYKEQGFTLLGVSADDEGPAMVKRFAAAHGLTYTIPMADADVQARYGVRAFPTTFIIDQHGVIRESFVGLRDYATFEAAVKPLLSAS